MRTFVYIGVPQNFDGKPIIPGQKVQEDFSWGSKTYNVGEIYDKQIPGCDEWALEEDVPVQYSKADKDFIRTCAVEAMKCFLSSVGKFKHIKGMKDIANGSFEIATLMNEKRKELNA